MAGGSRADGSKGDEADGEGVIANENGSASKTIVVVR